MTGGGDMRERVGHERTRHERVGHGDVGRGRLDDEGPVWGVGARPARRGRRLRAWRVGPGPRPVRPEVAPLSLRPPEAPRPVARPGRPVVRPRWVERIGLRLLTRRPAAVGPRYGMRRAVAGFALIAASAAVVVALGVLARAVGPAVAPTTVAVAVAPPAPVVVTAAAGETVWEVVDRVAPGASGPQRAALAERIVADNGLGSVRLRPGQVLRVPPG